tara:strand:+ start:1546 stop:1920 length:375 start_codon:yes stop_codon:yes gene_type:complete
MLEYKENSALIMMKLFILMTMVDDEYHEEERKMIHDLCMKYAIVSNDLEQVIKDVKNSSEDFISICKQCLSLITNQEIKNKSLKILAELSTADFILHENEIVMLELAAKEWGMTGKSLNELKIN